MGRSEKYDEQGGVMPSLLPYGFIERLKALPQVEYIYLFGSRARGDNKERSDIDLAVKISEPSNRSQWRGVMDIIEEADTLLQIDCVNLDEADEVFRTRILKEGKLL